MRLPLLAALTALSLGLAAPVLADETLLTGEMRRFAMAEDRPAVPGDILFADMDGPDRKLADFAGRPVVLNFWATWCAPCRAEMPSLDRLRAQMGDEVAVVTLASGRNPPQAVAKFFAETGITQLPRYLDPRQDLARAMGVFGMPVTVLIDAEGHEVGRLTGDAEWDSPEAVALIRSLLPPG